MTDAAPPAHARALEAQAAIDAARIRRQVVIAPLDVTPHRRECESPGCDLPAIRERRANEQELPWVFVCSAGHAIASGARFEDAE